MINRLIDHVVDGKVVYIYCENNTPTRHGCIIIIIHTECLQYIQPLCLKSASPLRKYTIQDLEKLHNGVVQELLDQSTAEFVHNNTMICDLHRFRHVTLEMLCIRRTLISLQPYYYYLAFSPQAMSHRATRTTARAHRGVKGDTHTYIKTIQTIILYSAFVRHI